MKKFFKGTKKSSVQRDMSPRAGEETGTDTSRKTADDDYEEEEEEEQEEEEEEEQEDEDKRPPSSYRSSLFSTNPTFDSFSTTPSSKPSSRTPLGKSRNDLASTGTRLRQIDEQGEMSSFFFKESDQNQARVGGFLGDDIGRPLRVINADLYNEISEPSSVSGSARASSSQRRFSGDHDDTADEVDVSLEALELEKNLKILNENLVELIDQLNDDSINISKATISMIDLFEDFQFPRSRDALNEEDVNLKKILKFFLQFHDHYLRFEVYQNSKKLVIRKFIEVMKKLGLTFDFDVNGTVPFLRNFAIPVQDNSSSSSYNSNIVKVEKILNKISNSSASIISDQQGAFIAPILRGFSDKASIISIMFGIPDPQPEHYDIIGVMYQTFPEIHFFIVKDMIKPCNDTSSSASEEKLYKFKPPFKLPNIKSPEISISISSVDSLKSSGTLACYLKPSIPSDVKDSNLLQYRDSKFALSCAHVLLSEITNKNSSEVHYPKVQTPSKVLINSYKTALIEQRDRYPLDSIEYRSFEAEIFNCENRYDFKLGQVIWGERILIHNKISDIAIVKVDNSTTTHLSNSLITNTDQMLMKDTSSNNNGLPISLSFKNSQIVKIIPKSQLHNHSNVFKVGSSTNYTTGSINGIKMVYWLEGHLQTSEFVVSSSDTFANAGDSGSMILNSLKDQFGLGSVGMLHSFDGELKQLGLFTTMEDIVDRLKDVTGVDWQLI